MNALLLHYNVRHQFIVFTASCYVSLRLTVQAVRPPVERIWRKLSSDEALDLYAYCIVFVHDIAILLGKLAIAAGNDYRHWADAFVESHLPPVPAATLPVVSEVQSLTRYKTIAPIQTPKGVATYISESQPDSKGISQITVRYTDDSEAVYNSNEIELKEVWVSRPIQNEKTLLGQLQAIAAASSNTHELYEQYEAQGLI